LKFLTDEVKRTFIDDRKRRLYKLATLEVTWIDQTYSR